LIVGHPFFGHLDTHMSVVMHRLCHLCLKPTSHAEREVIFSAGEKATHMHFIKGGNLLEYTLVNGEKLEPPPSKGEWVGEAVLWTDWRHQGELHSASTSDLIGVDPNSFIEVMCVHPRPWFYAKRYAVKFIKFLNGLDCSKVTDVLRDDVFYHSAVADCDRISFSDGHDGQDDSRDDSDSHGFPSDFSQSGDYCKNHDEIDDCSARFSPSPLWKGGGGGRAAPPRQRSSGWWPCGSSMPCETWCGPGPGQR